MVDVSGKSATHRVAVAEARLRMAPSTLALIRAGSLEKGDALAVARIAGISAAKQTPFLIPLCHPIPLTKVEVHLELLDDAVRIEARAETVGPTGVEMEALVAASTAALTLYDMAKSVERGMELESVRLLKKSGGRSGDYARTP